MIKVIFVDIDDTLLSFSGYVKKSMRNGFAKFSLKPYEDSMYPVFEKVNTSLWQQIEQGTLSYGELQKVRWNRIFQELGIDYDGEIFEAYFKDCLFSSAIPEPHAIEMLQYLADRYVLCAASNGPYAQQVNRLQVGGMYDYFSHVFVSSQVGALKPGKDFFDYCFRQLRKEKGLEELSPQETIIIGDSLTSDMQGGIDYGMKTCLYRKQQISDAVSACAEVGFYNIWNGGDHLQVQGEADPLSMNSAMELSSIELHQTSRYRMENGIPAGIDYIVFDLTQIREFL